MLYCIYNSSNDKFIIGEDAHDLVNQVYEIRITDHKELYATPMYYKEQRFHSFSEEFSADEMRKEIYSFLFRKLSSYGWTIFINVNR